MSEIKDEVTALVEEKNKRMSRDEYLKTQTKKGENAKFLRHALAAYQCRSLI